MPSVVTAGELLVEIMRPEPDVPFTEVGEFRGPYPSGAPGIFVDAVARLGRSAGIVGTVGVDEFGDVIVDRLERDGVDVTGVRRTDRRATGTAFVAYFGDGSRQFIYHMGTAAAGLVGPDDVSESYVDDADAVHVTGSSLLATDSMRAACRRLVDLADERDCLVSFDPNVRAALLDDESAREELAAVARRADVLLPTARELAGLTGIEDDDRAAATRLLEDGAELVAVTRGADGCTLYAPDRTVRHDGTDVDAVDPTGAGDAFAAGIVVGTLEGMPLEERSAFANATGGCAVTALGPMAGLAERAVIDELL